MKIEIQLPVNNLDFYKFTNSDKVRHLINKSCVYKLSFSDGKFYIGRTHNLSSRIYNHVSFSDALSVKKLTPKHSRMLKAIQRKENVLFEILDDDSEKERTYIKKYSKDLNNLNLALRK